MYEGNRFVFADNTTGTVRYYDPQTMTSVSRDSGGLATIPSDRVAIHGSALSEIPKPIESKDGQIDSRS